MSFDDDFDDVFNEFDIFRLIKKSQGELEKILKSISSGDVKGAWKIEQIDEPDTKGFKIQGRFGTQGSLQPLDPIEPFKPITRRPLPKDPFDIPKGALKETREALVDIFEEGNNLKVYVELPGVEKGDIGLDFGDGRIEVKAKNFHKTIDLPNRHIDVNGISTDYKNGVLEITIPKKKGLRRMDTRKLRAV